MAKPKIDFNALKRDNWSEQETQNAALVINFIQRLINDHDFDYILKKFDKGPYIQHNRSMADGVVNVVDYFRKMVKRFPNFSYDVKHIYVDGDHVIVHSHSTTNKKDRGNAQKGFNIKDTWKVKNGQLVEHWDAIQPIDGFMRFYTWVAGGGFKNSNTLF